MWVPKTHDKEEFLQGKNLGVKMDINIHNITQSEVFGMFSPRNPISNKGDYGRVLLICGSYGMAGAAVIAANACIASGAGLVNIVCPKSVYPIIAAGVPEAVFTPINDVPDDNDIAALKAAIAKADCAAIGCGLGDGKYAEKMLFTLFQNAKIPLIIDADGINRLCNNIYLLREAKLPIILTPHPGEMGRLCNISAKAVQADRIGTAKSFVEKYNVTLVLKGHETIVIQQNGDTYINHTGNAGMACAGSGDMLCGIAAALLAMGFSPVNAAKAAVFIHGLSGDLSAKEYSMTSTCPTTMQRLLPTVFRQIELSFEGNDDIRKENAE